MAMLDKIKQAVEAGEYIVPARLIASELVRSYYAHSGVASISDSAIQLRPVGRVWKMHGRPSRKPDATAAENGLS